MVAPSFGAVGIDSSNTGTAVAVDVPDGVVANSWVVIFLSVHDAAVTVTATPAGFTEAPDSPVNVNHGGSGFQYTMHVYGKRATGSESSAGTYDFTLSASAFHVEVAVRYDGVVTSGDPWDVTASAESAGANVIASPAVSDTTTVDDTLLVHIPTNAAGGPEGTTWTPATGFTARDEADFGIALISDKAQAVAGATGSITATATTADKSGAWLGALKPLEAVVAPNLFVVRSNLQLR